MTLLDPNTLPLSLGTFLLLRDLIRDRLGIWFDEGKRDLLASKLSDRTLALKLRTFLEYYYRLKYGADADDEWPRLMDALSVPETYFWREMAQIRAFVDLLMPQHGAGMGPVRIWSAACASGEEPFTLAMALNESGWFDRLPIELYASDASEAGLEKAVRGIYRERSFRALPGALREKYFSAAEGGWRIDPGLQARVHFRRANLLEPADTALFDSARYIFCRNVFIYFSAATISQIVERFAARMPQPAYLFVGVSESLLRTGKIFEMEKLGDAYVYVKR